MVRLKDTVCLAHRYRHNLFQFHNGSIKRLDHHIKFILFALFQFHNGSIKSAPFPAGVVVSDKFQFHNGSIKSEDVNQKKITEKRFNSTMVRLKVSRFEDMPEGLV